MGSQFSATSSFSGRVIVWWEESYYYDRGIRNIMAGSHYTLKNNDRGVFSMGVTLLHYTSSMSLLSSKLHATG